VTRGALLGDALDLGDGRPRDRSPPRLLLVLERGASILGQLERRDDVRYGGEVNGRGTPEPGTVSTRRCPLVPRSLGHAWPFR
jgi:hypothetical protein